MVRTVPYEGRVYCATVPNGTLIVRRGGKVMVAGNCRVYAYAALCGLMHFGLALNKRVAEATATIGPPIERKDAAETQDRSEQEVAPPPVAARDAASKQKRDWLGGRTSGWLSRTR